MRLVIVFDQPGHTASWRTLVSGTLEEPVSTKLGTDKARALPTRGHFPKPGRDTSPALMSLSQSTVPTPPATCSFFQLLFSHVPPTTGPLHRKLASLFTCSAPIHLSELS